MSRGMAATSLAIAFVLLAAFGATVWSSSDGSQFTVIAQDSEATFVPPDFFEDLAAGGQATEDAPVYRDGEPVGLAETIITITRIDGDDVAGIIECSVELPEGDVFLNGSFHFADLAGGASIPVVGGTGEYAGMVGTVVMTVSEDGSATTLAFDIG